MEFQALLCAFGPAHGVVSDRQWRFHKAYRNDALNMYISRTLRGDSLHVPTYHKAPGTVTQKNASTPSLIMTTPNQTRHHKFGARRSEVIGIENSPAEL